MATEQVANHVERALARLKHQFKDKAQLEAFLSILVEPVQRLEDTLWAMFNERSIDTAVGAQLDAIGKLVGMPRDGRVDDDYRRFVRAQISTNTSKGTVANLLTVASLVIDDADATFNLQQCGTAAAKLTIAGTDIDREFATLLVVYFMRKAAAAGVRVAVRFSPDDANRALWGSATYESTDVWGGSAS